MKTSRKLCGVFAIIAALVAADPVRAAWPVIDATNLAQQIQQVAAWGKQYAQMVDQLRQMQQQYNSLNGARGMAGLVNNPALRQYLPADYQAILGSGYANSADIRAAAKKYGIEDTTLGAGTDAARAFEASGRQAALNRAIAEDAYKKASARFADIQVLLDKVNAAPDAKDIADLQARIQAEQVMMQNESIKLAMMAQLQQAQRDLAYQQAAEIRMKSTKGDIPRF